MMANARKLAVKALCQVEKDSAYSNIILNNILSENDVSDVDRALLSALFYGVLDRRITIDYVLSKFLKKSVDRISPITVQALRIAVYQILFMERIPDSAAVDESVKIVKSSKEKFNSAFVNGVLRNVLRTDIALPNGDDVSSLSVKYSCPEWIVKSFINDYGVETTAKLLEKSLESPPVIIRVNTLKTDSDKLTQKLKNDNINAEKTAIDDALVIEGGLDIKSSECYKKGLFHIEDTASQIAVTALKLKPGERVLDICAAPGGKSFTMAQIMKNNGEIVAADLYKNRVSLISSGAERLGITCIKPVCADATVFNPEMGKFDAVLCDVPCSGLGVIRRKPEIKYKKCEDFSSLEKTQMMILENADKYIVPGGRLLYSTCTLKNSENSGAVKAFLDKHTGYELQYERTFMPHIDGSDGFYCALLVKSR